MTSPDRFYLSWTLSSVRDSIPARVAFALMLSFGLQSPRGGAAGSVIRRPSGVQRFVFA